MGNVIRWFGLGLCILVFYSASIRAQNWEAVGDGLPYDVRSFHSMDGLLYAGMYGGNSEAHPLCSWNGIAWDTVETACPGGAVFGMIQYQDDLVTVGCNNLQLWDGGTNWVILEGLGGAAIYGITVYQGDLIAVGLFDSIGGVAANGVGRWNGQEWSAIDGTVWESSAVYRAIEYQGDLYIGGNMINPELDIDRLGRWDGSQWHKVGNGIRGGIASVNCFEIYEGDLFVGGRFFEGNGNPGPNIARWDGEQWLDVGGGIYEPVGMGCDVRDMVEFQGELYAVGTCQKAGGVDALYISKWDGEEWCGFGDVFNNTIGAITVHQGELYIGGGFRTINNDTILRVAKWVGDDFTDQCGTLASIENEETNTTQFTIYPNPTASTTTLTWQGQTHGNYQLQLYDGQGKLILTESLRSAQGSKVLDLTPYAKGIYFGRLLVGEETRAFKVVKE